MNASLTQAVDTLRSVKRGQVVTIRLAPVQGGGTHRMTVSRTFHYFAGCQGIAEDAQIELGRRFYVRAGWLADGRQSITPAAS